jgi:hypothetical protein
VGRPRRWCPIPRTDRRSWDPTELDQWAETPEFTSDPFPINGVDLLDTSCDDWDGASLSPNGSGMILSVDSSDPDCGNFSVGYDMYMDMNAPQWGCGGVVNVHFGTGRMWAYVR